MTVYMIVKLCKVCDRNICVNCLDDLNHTDDGGGPFCPQCWFFVKQIQALEERINDLERVTTKLREPVSKRSPYEPRSIRKTSTLQR